MKTRCWDFGTSKASVQSSLHNSVCKEVASQVKIVPSGGSYSRLQDFEASAVKVLAFNSKMRLRKM